MSFNLKNHTSPKKTFCFLLSKKEQQAFFVVFCVFFSLHCGQKLEYFFFNFLSTEFIVRHFVAHQGRGVGIIIIIIIIIELQGDNIIFFLLFLKLNMLWMAFSIFFVKYVFVFSTTKRIFFFQKKLGGLLGVWRLTKKPKLGRVFFQNNHWLAKKLGGWGGNYKWLNAVCFASIQ